MIRRGFPYEWIYRGDIRMDVPGGYRSVVSVTSVTSGKKYAEVVLDATSGNVGDMIGITPLDVGDVAGSVRTLGVGINRDGFIYKYDAVVHSDATIPVIGDVINLALDYATLKVWIGVNNVWYGGGNPGAGTGETTTLNIDTFYIGASTPNFGGPGAKFSLRTQTSQFTGSIPSGFSPWYP